MSWEYIDYEYQVTNTFQKILIWANKNFNFYLAIKEKTGDSWTYYSGLSGHVLDTGRKLVNHGTSLIYAKAYSVATDIDSNGKFIAILPTNVEAKYIRLYIETGDNVTIHEFKPSTYFTAHEIVTGELTITDEISDSPKIIVTSNSATRIKIGEHDTYYGIYGYNDAGATIFELSDNVQELAGWSFNTASLTSPKVKIKSGDTAELLFGDTSSYANASIGLRYDGSGKLAGGNISWTQSGAVTITATLSAGEIHIPDTSTTNSFHVDADGDTWWNATPAQFNADINNASAYILKDGTAKFKSVTLESNVIISDLQPGSDVNGTYITSDTINTRQLKADSIAASIIRTGAIEASHISASSISASNLKVGIIDSVYITASAIEASHLKTDIIDANYIKAGAIETQHLTASIIEASHLKTSIISAEYINVTELSAITASMGTVTAGTILSSRYDSESAGFKIELNNDLITVASSVGDKIKLGKVNDTYGLFGYNDTGATIFELSDAKNEIAGWSFNAASLASTKVKFKSGANAEILLGDTSSYANASIGLKNDGSGKLAGGNISWDAAGNVNISAELSANELHSPNRTTKNSFHVNSDGDTYWNATPTEFALDNNNASAYVLKDGTAKFKSVTLENNVIISGLQNGSDVNGTFITNDTINTRHLKADSIAASIIRTGAIEASHISVLAIEASHISASSISASNLKVGIIDSVYITASAIEASHLKTNIISAEYINVNELSAITASVGTVTAGTILSSEYDSSNSGFKIDLNNDLITIASTVDRIRLGKYNSDYGLFGYDDTGATIFELSKNNKSIAGWYIKETSLSNNDTVDNASILLDPVNAIIRAGISTDNITINGNTKTIQSSDYVSGALGAGFSLSPERLEVGNIACRGIFRTAVFQKDTISAVGGNVLVSKGADVLDQDTTATGLITEGNENFAASDILRIKEDTYDEWLTVASVRSASNYEVIRDKASAYGGSPPSWTKGSTVVNYGQSGDGGVYITASESDAPYMSVLTHAGSPWSTINTHLRVGNMNGFLDSYHSADQYGIAVGAAASHLIYTPADGLIIRGNVTITGGSGIASLSDAGALAALNEVGTVHISNGAITADKIESGAVTAAKINVTELSAITASVGTVTAGTILSNDYDTSGGTKGFKIDLNNDLITVASIVDRLKIGKLVDTYGIFGYDDAGATSFGISDSISYIAGWSFNAASLASTKVKFKSGANAEILLGDTSSYANASIGLKNDGSGKLAGGNISWTSAGAVTITATLTAGEVHIPDTTTKNSFHVNSDGDTYWNATPTEFALDNNNASAYVLKDGTAKFSNIVISGLQSGSDVDGIYITDNTIIADKIAASAVEASHLKTDIIDANYIKSGAIETQHLTASIIEASHLKTDIIDANYIKSGAIETQHLTASIIEASHLKTDIISAEYINVNELSAITASVGTVTAGTILSSNYVEDSDGFGIFLNEAKMRVYAASGLVIEGSGGVAIYGDVITDDDPTNTFIGRNVGNEITSGSGNTFIGNNCGSSLTSGNNNIAIGDNCLTKNSLGNKNVAIGKDVLHNLTSAVNNIGIGDEVLYSNTSGHDNVAIGVKTMYDNTSGMYNIAFGNYALASNLNGFYNIAVGYNALGDNLGGDYNLALGYDSLLRNSNGDDNIGIGYSSLKTNASGEGNTALGVWSLSLNATGNYNTAIGYYSLRNCKGYENIGIGAEAGGSVGATPINGHNNILIGVGANVTASDVNYELNIANAIIGNTETGDITITGSLVVSKKLTVASNIFLEQEVSGFDASKGLSLYNTNATQNYTIAALSPPILFKNSCTFGSMSNYETAIYGYGNALYFKSTSDSWSTDSTTVIFGPSTSTIHTELTVNKKLTVASNMKVKGSPLMIELEDTNESPAKKWYIVNASGNLDFRENSIATSNTRMRIEAGGNVKFSGTIATNFSF